MRFIPGSFSLIALISFFVLFIYGRTSEICVSQGGRFPPSSNEGKPPRKASKDPREMTFCRLFRKKSCCDVTQTHAALLSVRRLASSGEANQDCLQLWELLECSICDPRIGVRRGPPIICASFCDRVYDACSTAYFSMDAKSQVLAPCGFGDFVCGKASEWVSNGTDLCHASGFSVKSLDDFAETSCFGEKDDLDYIVNSWKTSDSVVLNGKQNTGVLGHLRQLAVNDKVSWAVGGMVLTAGIFFASKRKSHNQRLKQATIQYRARKLGTRVNSMSPAGRGR